MKNYEERRIENDYQLAIVDAEIKRITKLLFITIDDKKISRLNKQLKRLENKQIDLMDEAQWLDCEYGDMMTCEYECAYLNGEA